MFVYLIFYYLLNTKRVLFISERPEAGIATTILFGVLMDAFTLQRMTVF